MDRRLAEAAIIGDVEYLREFVATNGSELEGERTEEGDIDYSNSSLLRQHILMDGIKAGNILHLAAYNGKEGFFAAATQILPGPLVHLLLSQPEKNTKFPRNSLHIAAREGHLGIVRLIMRFYESVELKLQDNRPWRALSRGVTPFHLALPRKNEECALEILTAVDDGDKDFVCSVTNHQGDSPLLLALKHGLNKVAWQILTSVRSYSVRGPSGSTPLHFAYNSSEEVLKLMLEKHPEFITAVDKGTRFTLLHHWTKAGKLWPLEYIYNSEDIVIAAELKRHLVRLMYATDTDRDTPFHIAARERHSKAARILAKIYREEQEKEIASSEAAAQHHQRLPWLLPNNEGVTPLELSLNKNATASEEYNRLKQDVVDMKSSAQSECDYLFLAIQKGLFHAAEAIWFTQHSYGWWSNYRLQGQQMWEAALNCSEEVAIWVAGKLPSLTSKTSEIIRTLDCASKAGFTRLIKRTLEKHPDALNHAPLAWVEACQKGHFATIMAFIDNCPDFREICIDKEETPLHHIRFKGYKQYQSFLKDPTVLGLKNLKDHNGETPLHKSIRTGNLLLTEVLLTTDGVIRSIKDKKCETAMDLLVKECKKSRRWAEMCKRNGIIPGLKTTYFQDKTNLLEARNTLSVVAALLATITFTAGFALPGGVKSDSTGKATLGNKAAFLVFLVADSLAMCCSMLVLVCLLWSMLCDHNKALLLIDRSMPVLLLALYSTLVAFMTGVYAVIPHRSLLAAIVILAMCSIFIVLSKRSIMYKLLDKSNPDMDRECSDEMQLLEQGEARSSQMAN